MILSLWASPSHINNNNNNKEQVHILFSIFVYCTSYLLIYIFSCKLLGHISNLLANMWQYKDGSCGKKTLMGLSSPA